MKNGNRGTIKRDAVFAKRCEHSTDSVFFLHIKNSIRNKKNQGYFSIYKKTKNIYIDNSLEFSGGEKLVKKESLSVHSSSTDDKRNYTKILRRIRRHFIHSIEVWTRQTVMDRIYEVIFLFTRYPRSFSRWLYVKWATFWKTIQYFSHIIRNKVEYHPTSVKDQARPHQFEREIVAEMFMNYEVYAGTKWKGDILVTDVDE